MARKHEKFSYNYGWKTAPEQWNFFYNGKRINLDDNTRNNLACLCISGKIKEAEDEIFDARQKVANIENPKWYILDRSSNNGYDSYIFKNNLIIEEWMVIYAEEVEPCHKLLPDWIHTRKFYDYKNKLIKIYSYDQFNNRIYDYDRVEKMF